jgi:alkylation response protein AidB-like acyl-CoA dehydrogenase
MKMTPTTASPAQQHCAAANGCCKAPIQPTCSPRRGSLKNKDDRADRERLRQQRRPAGAGPAEQKEWGLARDPREALWRASACLASTSPKEYGGVELDKVSSMVVSERNVTGRIVRCDLRRPREPARAAAFAVRTEDQKRRYLPRLLTGDLVGATA